MRAAVKSLFRSETFFSAASSLLPVSKDAMRGRMVTPTAITVISGEYHNISPRAPRKVTVFVIRESC